MSTVTTAQEYIDIYYSKLKKELDARGLQISKVGLIGLILHILGYSQQDIKLYYDTLFKEAFIATSDRYENLVMHGSVYGYTPTLAVPASLVGNISFDPAILPINASDDQTIILSGLKVKLDSYVYTMESKYIFKNNMCKIVDSSGNISTVPVSSTNPSIPIKEFKQYDTVTYSYAIPFYVYNSYYSIVIELGADSNLSVSDIDIQVKEDGSDVYTKYEYKLVNYSSSSLDKHVFAQFLPNNKVLIELGSGVHGKYIPNSTITITIKTTYGAAGNISSQTLTPYAGTLQIFNSSTSGAYTINVTDGVSVEIDYADNGQDQILSSELRSTILNFIRHRNNLVSELDFYDILKKYFEDFEVMFKKTHVMDNNIYVFTPFRDLYQLPIRSRSISVKHSEFNPKLKCLVYNPTFTLENGIEYISPFLYSVDYILRQYKAYILKQLTSSFFSSVETNYVPTDGTQLVALPLTFYASYNQVLDNTRLMVQSYESITDYTFLIDIPLLGIKNQCLNLSTDNVVDMYYYNTLDGTGIIFDPVDIIIKVYKSGILYFTYKLLSFSMVSDISDILSLKTFDGFVVDYFEDQDDTLSDSQQNILSSFNTESYVLNIPVLQASTYEDDPEYYLSKFIDMFASLVIEENRMISDDVQLRFINTDVILADQVKSSTKQSLDLNIKFPLHLSIKIIAYKDYIYEHNVDVMTEKNTLIETLAQKLFSSYTGTSPAIYQTQIIEIIHDLKWIKSCEVIITDDSGTQIPNNNIEILPQSQIINKLTKLQAVTYCPFYVWWNLDDISVTINYE